MRIVAVLLLIVMIGGCMGNTGAVDGTAYLQVHLPTESEISDGAGGDSDDALTVDWVVNGHKVKTTAMSRLPDLLLAKPRITVTDTGADGSVVLAIGRLFRRRAVVRPGQTVVVDGRVIANVGEDKTEVCVCADLTLFPTIGKFRPHSDLIVREHGTDVYRLLVSVRHLDIEIGRVNVAGRPPLSGADAGWPDRTVREVLQAIQIVSREGEQVVCVVADEQIRLEPGQSVTRFLGYENGKLVIVTQMEKAVARIDVVCGGGDRDEA